MPIHPGRPRSGRVLDIAVMALLFLVFAGLALYHYRRIDRSLEDPELAKEASELKLDEPAKTRESKDTGNDWPQWRGPNRDGVSTETIVAAWPKNGPPVLWQAKVGEGFASVAVAKGRVYTIFQAGSDEAVVCWDEKTGHEIWRHAYPCRYKNSYGSGPRATPTVDGEFVYTLGATGILHCLKAFTANPQGEIVWTKNLKDEFNAPIPQWGFAFSPLVEGDRLFVLPGGPAGNALAALDKNTGAVLWRKCDDRAGYSSPIAANFFGERQILFLTGSRLVSVKPETGAQLWDFPWPVENDCNIATPIVVKDSVFLSASYTVGCTRLKIEKHGETLKPRQMYKNARMRNHFSTSVRYKDHLFGFDDITLVCMNFVTGKVAWKESGFDKGSVLLVGDQLIVYGANGRLALAEANSLEYVERARFKFSEQGHSCWSVPVVANGRLYVRDQERLVCFDVRLPPSAQVAGDE
jgi:outer membrane protein assembly factor BamB